MIQIGFQIHHKNNKINYTPMQNNMKRLVGLVKNCLLINVLIMKTVIIVIVVEDK